MNMASFLHVIGFFLHVAQPQAVVTDRVSVYGCVCGNDVWCCEGSGVGCTPKCMTDFLVWFPLPSVWFVSL